MVLRHIADEREIRLGLVLNGGVSLAVWIGGVTNEIDAVRRARAATGGGDDTALLYRDILEACQDRVVVDVIAGASAGGINGVLLGASIFTGQPLRGLRETWIGLGDFRGLLHGPKDDKLYSVMRGDAVFDKLSEVVGGLYEERLEPPDQPLFLYVTATDLFGVRREFSDSLGRTFEERDYRRVFTFQHEPGQQPGGAGTTGMRPVIDLDDPGAAKQLAAAGRASSSFPVAFESREIETPEGGRWFVDGGILDNQPFNPVLDRIAILPATGLVKRAVMFVVPYVTDVGSDPDRVREAATALETYQASGKLPRELPKLASLIRVTRERATQERAESLRYDIRHTLTADDLRDAAKALFKGYCATRLSASLGLFELWASPGFQAGDGVSGQSSADDPPVVLPPSPAEVKAARALAPLPWLPESVDWTPGKGPWQWGLGPGERTAAWSLLFLRDALRIPKLSDEARAKLLDARALASDLVRDVRAAKPVLYDAFDGTAAGESPALRAIAAFGTDGMATRLAAIQDGFIALEQAITEANAKLPERKQGVAHVADLLHLEVVRNAMTIRDESVPFPFQFVFASAGIGNSLGHPLQPPDPKLPNKKLAGMKLGHFGGFLKGSWRANDWLWGRLDGVEHVLRAILDLDRIAEMDAGAKLAEVAFPDEGSPERAPLVALWSTATGSDLFAAHRDPDPRAAFLKVLAAAQTAEAGEQAALFAACRSALAARIQLQIIRAELPAVAGEARKDVAAGTSEKASGAVWAAGVRPTETFPVGETQAALDLFRTLDIGQETLRPEIERWAVIATAAQGAAVVVALLGQPGGGLPRAARAAIGTLRRVTLTFSRYANWQAGRARKRG